MGNPLWMRLRKVKWTDYDLTESQGKEIQNQLNDLSSRKEVRAMRASQKLWSLLKPGAAVGPVLEPILLDIRKVSSDMVQREIDEILARITAV